MTREPFITRPLSLWLDLVRALAAFVVLVGHAYQNGLYTGPYPFTIALQLNAVVVFFVLSGLVIASSSQREGTSLGSYAAARIARIVPTALLALAMSYGVGLLAQAHGVSAVPIGMDDGNVSWERTLLSAAFLNESLSTGLAINPPFWSLCYEVWFYALYGAGLFLTGGKRLAWLALMALVAGANVLLLLPAWLAGVWLVRSPWVLTITPARGPVYIVLALTALLSFRRIAPPLEKLLGELTWWDLGHSHYALAYILIAACIALGFAGLRAVLGDQAGRIARYSGPIKQAADMSFTLYVLHWPLLILLRIAGVSSGSNVLLFALLLGGVAAVCWLVSKLVEQRRQGLRTALERLFTLRGAALTA
ncbi:MAG: acyltransferase [Novosphingobium sp.]